MLLDPWQIGSLDLGTLRVDTKDKRGTQSVQEVEQNLPLMDQNRGREGETRKVAGVHTGRGGW